MLIFVLDCHLLPLSSLVTTSSRSTPPKMCAGHLNPSQLVLITACHAFAKLKSAHVSASFPCICNQEKSLRENSQAIAIANFFSSGYTS